MGAPRQTGRDHQCHQHQGSPGSQFTNRHRFWTRSMIHPGGAARCSCRRAPGPRLTIMWVQGTVEKRAEYKAVHSVGSRARQEGSQQIHTARDRAGHRSTYTTTQAIMGCPDMSLNRQGVDGSPKEAGQGSYSLYKTQISPLIYLQRKVSYRSQLLSKGPISWVWHMASQHPAPTPCFFLPRLRGILLQQQRTDRTRGMQRYGPFWVAKTLRISWMALMNNEPK